MEHKSLSESSSEQLLAYASLTMAKLALEAKPETKTAINESYEAIQIVKERISKSLGNLAVESKL